MKVRNVIAGADALRPNRLPDEQKARYVFDLDADFAETMGTQPLAFTWPCEDTELQMPYPHDGAYVMYLMAMIDAAQQETDLYANDMAMAAEAVRDAKAWWRRHNVPANETIVRTM